MKVILSSVSIARFLKLKEKLIDEGNLIAYLLCAKENITAIDSEHIEIWNKIDKLLKRDYDNRNKV